MRGVRHTLGRGGAALVLAASVGCGDAHSLARATAWDGSPGEGGPVDALAPGAPGVLAAGQANPSAIALDDANVYWVDLAVTLPDGTIGQRLLKCAKRGCAAPPTVLAEGFWGVVRNLVVAGGSAYWGGNNVYRCSTDGCAGHASALYKNSQIVDEVAVDAVGDIYFTSGAFGGVMLLECPAGDCSQGSVVDWLPPSTAPVTGTTQESATPLALATDARDLYVLAQASVAGVSSVTQLVACSVGDCVDTAQILLTTANDSAHILAADDLRLYFAEDGLSGGASAIESLAKAETGPASSSTTLVAGVSFPSAIASDGTHVYFAELGDLGSDGTRPPNAGAIRRCAVSGCGGQAEPVRGYVDWPQGLALDDTNVYWTELDTGPDGGVSMGRVMAQAK